MYVNKIDDPRGPLERADRDELYAYARANNVTEIDEAMYMGAYAQVKMRKILISKGLTNIQTKLRPFGETAEQPSGRPAIDADSLADLPAEPLAPRFDAKTATRAELAKECKRRGIRMARTDSKEQLRERISA